FRRVLFRSLRRNHAVCRFRCDRAFGRDWKANCTRDCGDAVWRAHAVHFGAGTTPMLRTCAERGETGRGTADNCRDGLMIAFSTCWNSSRHTDGAEMLREIVDLGFDRVELGHGIRISLMPGIQKAFDAGEVRFTSLHNFCTLPVEVMMA